MPPPKQNPTATSLAPGARRGQAVPPSADRRSTHSAAYSSGDRDAQPHLGEAFGLRRVASDKL